MNDGTRIRGMREAINANLIEENATLKAENEHVKELIANNLKQIGELQHYQHERVRVLTTLKFQLQAIKKAGEWVQTLSSCLDEEGIDDMTDITISPSAQHYIVIAKLVRRLAEKLDEVEDG